MEINGKFRERKWRNGVKRMESLFWCYVRANPVIRVVCLPWVRWKRRIGYKKYKNSEDSKYIKGLKDSCSGERCFIIGNGPSLSREDLDLLTSEKTFAFNRIYEMYPYTKWRPTYYMVVDNSILQKWRFEDERALEAKTAVFLTHKKVVEKYNNQKAYQVFQKDVAPIQKRKPIFKRVCEDVSQYISVAQSVTINAMEMAFYMGFKEIYLLGLDHDYAIEIDMRGKKYIDKNIKPHFEEDSDRGRYFSFKEAMTIEYELCKKYADEHGIKIINVTRGGKLEVFERDCLAHVLLK